jgi:hypothetical protein
LMLVLTLTPAPFAHSSLREIWPQMRSEILSLWSEILSLFRRP